MLAAPAVSSLSSITVEVIGSAMASIVEEMGKALIRSAYSTDIKERGDCSTILFNARGETLVQAEHIPIHLGSLMGIAEEVLRHHPIDSLRPGDMFIGNDAYRGGGTHLPDIAVISPIFIDGHLVAFTANVAHHADFVDRGHDHIFQEGLRIPPTRIFEGGKLREDLLEFILLNCQVPDERLGDFNAQFAANFLGVRRFQALCAKYGVDTVVEAGNELLGYAERQTRAGIRAIRNGRYAFQDLFDNEELGSEELTLRVTVDVHDDEMTLDFRDNPPQTRSGLNMVKTALLATTYYAVKIVADPTILPNSGMYRPLTILATPGSILCSTPPAAVNMRTQTAQRVVDLILGALAQAVPNQVIGACSGSNAAIDFAGVHPRTGHYYAFGESIGGGFGARASKDGLDGVQTHVTNTSNIPIESLEDEFPLLVERYELVPDSGGPGMWRGGLAIRREVRVLDHTAVFRGSTSRRFSAPWGLFGGHPGGRARITIDGDPLPDDSRGAAMLSPGQVIEIVTGGAGGYGSPQERDPGLVARDVQDGKVSVEQASQVYGLSTTYEA